MENIIRKCNISVMRVPKEENKKEQGRDNIWEIVIENFPERMKARITASVIKVNHK